jgi:selenide,water dikinase
MGMSTKPDACILSHFRAICRNLAQHQLAEVSFELTQLPVISGMLEIDAAIGHNFRLAQGFAAETSGGLLIAMPPEAAEQYIREIQEADGKPAWIVGRVIEGNRTADIAPDCKFLAV